ncbi:MAG: hypothetical protein JNM88_16710 [Chitinophagaceae bacterium]|nr:hypothetical protein [Chitinophagaceae bacterium]
MKKTLLYLSLLFATIQGIAQNGITLAETNNKVSVDISQAPLPVVQKTTVPLKPAVQDTSKRFVIWLEAGNGFFSTDPLVEAPLDGKISHNSFLQSTRLYDTTKDLRFVYQSNASNTNTQVNPRHDYLYDRGIKIIPNVYDIVPGDTMAFAIAYQTLSLAAPPVSGTHKIYFFYNNQSAFTPAIPGNILLPGTNITECRTHNGETPTASTGFPPNLNFDPEDGPYSNYIMFTIPENSSSDHEKNVFVSLVSNSTLEYGNSCSVYAVLTDSADNVLGTDIIPNMRFAPAHDPNYIVQNPVCSALPKKAQPFTYTVHFQNTGEGDAAEVKAEIFLPRGMNWSAFNPAQHILSADFGGRNVKGTSNLEVRADAANNKLIVRFFKPGHIQETTTDFLLRGTTVDHPATNPATMGEITFILPSTADTDDTLKAWAAIHFLSQHPVGGIKGVYEKPVYTDTVLAVYKKCCEPGCDNTDKPDTDRSCKKFIGLCWWWWVIILLAIISLWFIIARRRRKKKHQHPYQS